MCREREVTVEVTVKLQMKVDEGTEISEVINEMDYNFNLPDNANLDDEEIINFEVI